ncbi:hypothetical protein GXM_03027 [Nostoc sphaeroides CCNUC1]|uniref:Uncharacterized protein n=1 Tax=Nostoc sphaeroides CCNUC1 TaxID=2653204 RepID=A0A5P8VYS6_9NOSO|nr:hypothetical protein GXM_03027 [Nostoc sphaeroides CCNUC1]
MNLRHPAPKAGALPSCATSRFDLSAFCGLVLSYQSDRALPKALR